jgi:cellulose biosynthesis protein BcsQ
MADPLVIAIVSGKGGVGKTMLAVAIAGELAKGTRTLLIDLDFFNRGLTGLFASEMERSQRQRVQPSGIIGNEHEDVDWGLSTVGRNLFLMSHGDPNRPSSSTSETVDVEALSKELSDYVIRACKQSDCEIAILDCAGGPDATSFAGCAIADHTIIVSEPDKITLYGTLNFVRQLTEIPGKQHGKTHLVFNKVIPSFSARFLRRFYNDYLRDQFDGQELLAIYPLESHLTKGFEKTPFLTTAYPTSQLAEKTRFLLNSLLGQSFPSLLPVAFRRMSWGRRFVNRYYLGRLPRILDLDFGFRLIAVSAILFIGVPALYDLFSSQIGPIIPNIEPFRDDIRDVGLAAIVGLAGWLLIAVAINWMRDLDIFLTYGLRVRNPWIASIGCVAHAFLCLMVSFVGVSVVVNLLSEDHRVSFAFLIPAMVIIGYLYRGLCNIRFDRSFIEGAYRIGLSLGCTAVFTLPIAAMLYSAFTQPSPPPPAPVISQPPIPQTR